MSERETRPVRTAGDEPTAAEADVYEQERELVDDTDEVEPAVPEDVDPADAQEQQLIVDYDDEDYR